MYHFVYERGNRWKLMREAQGVLFFVLEAIGVFSCELEKQ